MSLMLCLSITNLIVALLILRRLTRRPTIELRYRDGASVAFPEPQTGVDTNTVG